MNLLYITTNVPWPLNSGGNQAFYMMADYIRHCHQLSLLFKVRNSEEKKAVEVLKRKWDNVTFYVLDESSEVYRKSDRLLESLSWYDSLMYRMFDFISHSVQRKMRRKIRKIDFVKSNSTLYEDLDGINHVFCDYVYEISRKGYKPISLEVLRNGEKVTINDVTFPVDSSEGVSFGLRDFGVNTEEKTFSTLLIFKYEIISIFLSYKTNIYFNRVKSIKYVWS